MERDNIMLKRYNELANWWPLLSPLEEYADEAAFFCDIFAQAGLPESPSLLELGCGGGNNAFYLKQMFAQVTLTDIAHPMLAISEALNPECEHLVGDMRKLRLGRSFDALFIHDAIDYMKAINPHRWSMSSISVDYFLVTNGYLYCMIAASKQRF